MLGRDPWQAPLLAQIAGAAGRFQLEKAIWRWGLGKLGPDIALLWGLAGSYLRSGKPFQARKLLLQALKMSAGTRKGAKLTHGHGLCPAAFPDRGAASAKSGTVSKEATFIGKGCSTSCRSGFLKQASLQRAIRHGGRKALTSCWLNWPASSRNGPPPDVSRQACGIAPVATASFTWPQHIGCWRRSVSFNAPTVAVSPGADFLPILYWLKAYSYRERGRPAVGRHWTRSFPV